MLLMEVYIQMGTVMNAIVKDVVFGWRISVSIKFIVATLLATVGTIILPRSPRLVSMNIMYEERSYSYRATDV